MGASSLLKKVIMVLAVSVISTNAYAQSDESSSGDAAGGDEGAAASAGLSTEGGSVEVDSNVETPTASKSDKPWSMAGSRHLPTLTGPTGLFHTMEAGSDEPKTFALGLHGAFFKYRDYMTYGDEQVHMWGGLALRITPVKHLEIFAGLAAQAYSSNIPDILVQTLGNFNIGLKGYVSPIAPLTLGLVFGLELTPPIDDISVTFKGVTIPLGLLITGDFTQLNKKIPLRAHFNAVYRFDNTAKLIESYEDVRGGCGTDIDGDGVLDYNGCISPAERKGLELDRTDQFRFSFGFDAPLPYITPLIEYNLDVPVNRQDFRCPIYSGLNVDNDSCMDVEGGRGMRQTLTLGFRILPPVRTLSIDFGVDIGLAGYAPTVQEIAPQSPYRILFGLTYGFAPSEKSAEPCPEPEAAEPIYPQPVIAGYVYDSADENKAIEGAFVKYADMDANDQVTDSNGKFRSYPMPTGKVAFTVSAKGYEDASFEVEIPNPAEAADQADPSVPQVIAVSCPLKIAKLVGRVTIKVEDKNGSLSDATVELSGPEFISGKTSDKGLYQAEVTPGHYSVLAKKDGYFERERVIEAVLNEERELTIILTEKPSESSVEVTKNQIALKKMVFFVTGSSEIMAESLNLLDEVVDVLRQYKDFTKVEIQGHTDNRGGKKMNMELSQRRAESVMDYLVKEGISADRLTAKGFGPTKPKAPNVTAAGRAKNRRVEFHIKERAK